MKATGIHGATALAFSSLGAAPARAWFRRPFSPDYGSLSPKADLATGLKLLALPDGFCYRSFGWTGQIMDDGRPTPTDHDGMAVVARRGRTISLVRNHELSAREGSQAYVEGGMYNPSQYGGTTNLHFDLFRGEFVKSKTAATIPRAWSVCTTTASPIPSPRT